MRQIGWLQNAIISLRPSYCAILGTKTEAKTTKFSSKAFGTRENKAINLEGRLQLDMYQAIQRDYKLRSYTLNSVSAHFLGKDAGG